MKRYNIVNNALGWFCFLIAAVTYLLTIEPTASFWDCPEFIAQGAKLEVGHPPGNPIFMLTARFFVTIFGGGMSTAAIAVNTMSALLSAATILLLFWTITHLVRKIMLPDNAEDVPLHKLLVIMGSGLCGALAYTWSDTFWFSAVEGEVYAFSSFCTALVFWLILKWENRADQPHSDRYLILIAYVIGVSIAVHLLNLLCIPAIVLVFYYRKWKQTNVKGSLIALGVSFVIVAAILYGLVPGFIKVAQGFELFFVNSLGFSFNMGVLIYAILLVGLFIFTIHELYKPGKPMLTNILFIASVICSGILFITDHVWLWVLLCLGVGIYVLATRVRYRIYSLIVLSLLVIFTGYASYALLLIRASANPPMNQNAPDNVFTLASYLNREQYGETPLFSGPVLSETVTLRPVAYNEDGTDYIYGVQIDRQGRIATKPYDGTLRAADGSVVDNGEHVYVREVKTSPDQPDRYIQAAWKPAYENAPEINMFFTRMYSTRADHVKGYKQWSDYENTDIEQLAQRIPPQILQAWIQRGYVTRAELNYYMPNAIVVKPYGESTRPDETELVWKASFGDNINYFLNYQLNHMYWRYFMWNFAGRQNDIQNSSGEPHIGNWITGIPFIDNARLGDQSLLPEEYTTGNKGHNVFYMLPLLMGILGLLWQSMFRHKSNPKRGIEQFWVIFFLFFMTGIAIVLYLNQPPNQPRERDYAFAGSFYAFAIWLGMGVPALYRIFRAIFGSIKKDRSMSMACAVTACVIGVIVPLQMVSQTWDDHDRSNRYTTRDFGANYLNSLEPNAVIFTNGDNDTFPLWYAQEVEGERTDVRVVNLSYLATDWYANQLQHPYYDAAPVHMTATPLDYAYDKLQFVLTNDVTNGQSVDAIEGLRAFYADPKMVFNGKEYSVLRTPHMHIVPDSATMMLAFDIDPESIDSITMMPYISPMTLPGLEGSAFSLSTLLSFDIVANSIAEGFKRPVYFASTVPNDMYLGLSDYLNSTGMAYQVTPFKGAPVSPMVEKAYENIVAHYRWGGLDDPEHNTGLYLDETVRRMVSSMRNSIVTIASDLAKSGDLPASEFAVSYAAANGLPIPQNRYDMARYLLQLMDEKMPPEVSPYEGMENYIIPEYMRLYAGTRNPADLAKARELIDKSLARNLAFLRYATALDERNFYKLGSSAVYARINIPNQIAYRNMGDLLEKAYALPAGEAREAAIQSIYDLLDVDAIYYNYDYINPYVFIDGSSADELREVAEIYQGTEFETLFNNGAAVVDLSHALGIDPAAYATEAFQRAGVEPSVLSRLDVYLK